MKKNGGTGEIGMDLTQGKPLSRILLFSLPILAGNIFQQLYTVVDGMVVGIHVSTEALAAVGAGFPIIYMITSIFLGLGLGASILVSQFFGANNMRKVRSVFSTMHAFMFIISIPLTILAVFTTGAFLNLLNVPEDVFEPAKLYMIIYYIGMLPQFGYNVNASVIQGLGDSRTPLYILISSSLLHVVLAYLFVVVIPWGVAGVAWSTVLSQLFSWIASIVVIKRKYPELQFRFLHLRINKTDFAASMKIGLPIGLQNALFSVGMMVMQPLINSYGAVFIAGYNAAVKVDGFVFMPVTSLATAITTYVGQNLGAGKQDRLKTGIRATTLLVVALCALLCAIVLPLQSQLMYLFTKDVAVVEAGNAYLIRVIPLYVISTLQYMLIGILRGAGRSLVPTIATLVSLWLARVPAAFLLSHYLGGNDMHWCYAIGWAMGLAILVPYYFGGKWRKTAVVDEILKKEAGHETDDPND
ncbi:MAG: MATE family efflux transporter [Clostridiales Family XIII bacterium]|jgi:putative MATE family efflux protein|nr:MATE family efflux transporter [Clostridiales Family XIII bacterium]